MQSALTIKAHIFYQETQVDWWFVGIYASCVDNIRKNQWKIIENRKRMWGSRWIIVGDFNDIRSNEEKWDGSARQEWSFKDFRNFIANSELINIGFKGYRWTRSNNWEEEREIRQRLDGTLSNLL